MKPDRGAGQDKDNPCPIGSAKYTWITRPDCQIQPRLCSVHSPSDDYCRLVGPKLLGWCWDQKAWQLRGWNTAVVVLVRLDRHGGIRWDRRFLEGDVVEGLERRNVGCGYREVGLVTWNHRQECCGIPKGWEMGQSPQAKVSQVTVFLLFTICL